MLAMILAQGLVVVARVSKHMSDYYPSARQAAGASLLMGIIAMLVWKHRGGTRLVGFLWGFLLNLIGLIVVLVATPSAVKERED